MLVSTDLEIDPMTDGRESAISNAVSFSNRPGMLFGQGALAASMLFKSFVSSDFVKLTSLKWSARIADGNEVAPFLQYKLIEKGSLINLL